MRTGSLRITIQLDDEDRQAFEYLRDVLRDPAGFSDAYERLQAVMNRSDDEWQEIIDKARALSVPADTGRLDFPWRD